MRRFFSKLHQVVGFSSALFVIILSISGLLLQHAVDFDLDNTAVPVSIVKLLADTPELERAKQFLVDQQHISQVNNTLMLDDKVLDTDFRQRLIGAVAFSSIILLATDQNILLYSSEGELIDKLSLDIIDFEEVQNIGVTDQFVWLVTNNAVWQSDENLIEWNKNKSSPEINWSAPIERFTPKAELLYPKISVERLFQEIHSGRILGGFGKLLMDLSAFALLYLSISGIWFYLSKRRKTTFR